MEDYSIISKWDLWFHSINENKWDKSSYKNLYPIENGLDYQIICESFKQNHYQNGMFFIMKRGIFPNWEDPDNRSGGCLSFKISSEKVIDCWNYILLKCIEEKIMNNYNDKINGLSISPKKEFNIMKIWFSEKNIDYTNNFIKYSELNIDNSLYKEHSIK